MQSIGRNATIRIAGAWKPTTAVMYPSVAASEYPGAVDATPMTTFEMNEIAPVLRVGSSVDGAVTVAICAHYAQRRARVQQSDRRATPAFPVSSKGEQRLRAAGDVVQGN